jgi:hypothetical protein
MARRDELKEYSPAHSERQGLSGITPTAISVKLMEHVPDSRQGI